MLRLTGQLGRAARRIGDNDHLRLHRVQKFADKRCQAVMGRFDHIRPQKFRRKAAEQCFLCLAGHIGAQKQRRLPHLYPEHSTLVVESASLRPAQQGQPGAAQ